MSYLIIGPSKAGKTGILSILQLATAYADPQSAIKIRPTNVLMNQLFQKSQETIRDGRLPLVASEEVECYSFTLEYRVRRLFGWGTETCDFEMIDGPGGGLFVRKGEAVDPGQLAACRAKIIDRLMTTQGLILCLDASDPETAVHCFMNLRAVFDETYLKARAEGRTMNRLPVRRLAICLTKCDRYASLTGSGGTSALKWIEEQKPAAHARKLLTPPGINALKTHFDPDIELGVGWASTYGFIESEGSANYDPQQDCMALSLKAGGNQAEVLSAWRPYHVLDPFTFLAIGAGDSKGFRVAKLRDL